MALINSHNRRWMLADIFHYRRTRFFRKMLPLLFEKEIQWNDNDCSNNSSSYETYWREAYRLLLSWKTFHWLALDLSTSAHKSSTLLVVIAFGYSELELFPSRAILLIRSFKYSHPSFHTLSFLSLSFFLYFVFQIPSQLVASTLTTACWFLSLYRLSLPLTKKS